MKHEWYDENTKRWYPISEITLPSGEVLPARIKPFKPSNDQLIKYMKHKGHQVPMKKVKDARGKVETGEQKELVKVYRKTKDPLYKAVLEYRGCETAISRYVDKWNPSNDGRVHSEFMYVPASGQLNSVNPNAQNFIKHGNKDGAERKYAERLRGMVVAPPGFRLVECVVPETKLLMTDLTWKQIGDIKEGEQIVGVDESPVFVPTKKNSTLMGKRSSRYLRFGTVLSTRRILKECLKITTTKGVVTCSKDHNWSTKIKNGDSGWKRADQLKVGHEISYFVKPWEVETSTEVAWLAGIFDGEGYLGGSSSTSGRGCGFGQNDGVVAETAVKIIENLGFEVAKPRSFGNYKCKQYNICGGAFPWLRFVGAVRPIRLLPKAIAQIEGMSYWGKNSSNAVILDVEDVGVLETIAMETSIKTYIAEGMISHNCDYKAFHGLTTGFEARDASYMRLARLDMHSFVTAHFCYLQKMISASELPETSWEDDRLIASLKDIKKRFPEIRDTRAKPAGLGYGFGMGPNKLHAQNDETISLKEAKILMKLLDELFPIAKKWRQDIKFLADRQGYLVSRHGFIRWFWDVFSRKHIDGSWQVTNGSDAEDAIAFLPSNDGHGHIQYNMVKLEEQGVNDEYNLINMIHDSLLYLMPESKLSEGIRLVRNQMQLPSLVLVDQLVAPNGLSVGVDVKVGKSWDQMKDWKD